LRGKRNVFLGALMIFLYIILACQMQGVTLPHDKQFISAEEVNLAFPAMEGNLIKVIPGGQSIGVLIHSQGVIVAGYAAVLDEAGNKVNPAVDAGLKEGDIILKVNGGAVKSDGQVREFVARAGAAGQSVTLEVKRGDEIFQTRVNPVFCKETLRYRLGLVIRDSAVGVGTLTFYEPGSLVYGALGHIIVDPGTSRPVELQDGKIIGASIQSIHRGKRGQPGEKLGVLRSDKFICGDISKNTKVGIFGYLQKTPESPAFSESIPVAAVNQIHEGQAEILTVLNGDMVEKFNIEIVKINPLATHDGKGLVIKITDHRLLDQAGGIIQGMSGSPIIQDNRLVGAVTHVLVNDPARGYGVPAEWMLQEGEILPGAQYGEKTRKIAG